MNAQESTRTRSFTPSHRPSILAGLLLAGAGLFAATGCSEASAHSLPASESSSSLPNLAEAFAPRQEQAGDTPSPWTPEVLDTGVDLSEVEADEPAATDGPEPVAVEGQDDEHAGHDHKPVRGEAGDGENENEEAARLRVAQKVADQQRVAAQRGAPTVYGGGLPDEKVKSEHPDSGFISIEESASSKDFGNLSQGDKVEHSFELTVSGKGDIIVDRIQPSCGCTVAQTETLDDEGKPKPYLYGEPLKPGSKLIVRAKLDTNRKRDRMVSVLTLMSNDPRGSMQIRLMANVVPFIAVDPNSINFGQLRPSDVVSNDLDIKSTAGEVFALKVAEELLPQEIKVELQAIDPAEDGRSAHWKAKVTLGPKIPEGARRTYTIQLQTDQVVEGSPLGADQKPTYHTTLAYAVATVTGQVSASPAYMSFGLMKSGQEISRTVRIENHDEDFSLPAPEIVIQGYNGEFEHPDAATIEVTEVVAGRSFDVKLTMKGPEDLQGTFRGKLRINVGHPDKEFIELPFTGVVRKPTPSPRGSQ